jgi:hypothetical protein
VLAKPAEARLHAVLGAPRRGVDALLRENGSGLLGLDLKTGRGFAQGVLQELERRIWCSSCADSHREVREKPWNRPNASIARPSTH